MNKKNLGAEQCIIHYRFCEKRKTIHMHVHACMLSHFSCVQLFATLKSAHQAPMTMGFSRQEYWDGLPCPPPGDLPNPGTNFYLLCLLHWQAGSCFYILLFILFIFNFFYIFSFNLLLHRLHLFSL